MTEDQLIRGCQKFDPVAQQLLYETYSPYLRGVCKRYFDDQDQIKDVMQECFIKVFSNIKKFKRKGSFEGWIKRVLINTCISYFKKHKKEESFLKYDEIYEGTTASDSTFIDDKSVVVMDKKDVNPDNIDMSIIEAAELSHDELLETLKELPEHFRIVFNLHCIEQMSHEDIARMIGIDIVTSRTRLVRARALVQKLIYEKSVKKVCK